MRRFRFFVKNKKCVFISFFLKVKIERQNIEKFFMDSIKSFGELM